MARSIKTPLILSEEDKRYLQKIRNSRTEQVRRVERATILLHYADGISSPQIAKLMQISVPNTDKCINKALQFGVNQALEDFKRSGRPIELTPEANAWIVSLACQKPKELGYSYELWTMNLLAQHIRKQALAEGHPSAALMAKGTVSRLLSSHDLQPHKVTYYLERRDPDFDAKRVQVLHVYQQVEWKIEDESFQMTCDVVVSYDEKPGIQAISTTSPDLPPVPGQHKSISRDYEYVRHGTMTLMAAIDLVSGEVLGSVVDRHRSKEFVDFLQMLDNHYASDLRIQVVLDNHSAHTSKETKAYLETMPNRFEFVFTPKHGSWLNVIETFFSKMTCSFLRGIRVASKEELKERIELYLKEVNANPVPFRWKYGMESTKK